MSQKSEENWTKNELKPEGKNQNLYHNQPKTGPKLDQKVN